MAKIHIYIREQVSGSDADVQAIENAVKAVEKAVEAAGGGFKGTVAVELDPPEPVAAEAPAAAV